MTKPAPLHTRVFIRQELPEISLEKSIVPDSVVATHTIRDLIHTLESCGYQVFADDRVKIRQFEYRVNSFMYRHQPEFRQYTHDYIQSFMASSLAQAVKDDMVCVQFPERTADCAIPFKSHVSLIVPTLKELELERDCFIEAERRRKVEENDRGDGGC